MYFIIGNEPVFMFLYFTWRSDWIHMICNLKPVFIQIPPVSLRRSFVILRQKEAVKETLVQPFANMFHILFWLNPCDCLFNRTNVACLDQDVCQRGRSHSNKEPKTHSRKKINNLIWPVSSVLDGLTTHKFSGPVKKEQRQQETAGQRQPGQTQPHNPIRLHQVF